MDVLIPETIHLIDYLQCFVNYAFQSLFHIMIFYIITAYEFLADYLDLNLIIPAFLDDILGMLNFIIL